MGFDERNQRLIQSVYIAGPWAERHEMFHIADRVDDAGLDITRRWWEEEDAPEEDRNHDFLREQAKLDMQGVIDADAVILINSQKSEGKAVEQGIALALGKPIFAVGKLGEHSKNVFHYLPNYYWYDTLDNLMEMFHYASRSNQTV